MGEMSKALLTRFVGTMFVEAVDSLLTTSRNMAALARMILDERESLDYINVEQIVEASARCVDIIELLVLSAKPDDDDMEEWEASTIKEDLEKVTAQLDRIRQDILQVGAQDDDGT